MKRIKDKIFSIALIFIVLFVFNSKVIANGLYIGTSTVDITPELPVALDGQMHLRIAEKIETPLEANIVVIESRNNNEKNEAVIFISCDLVAIPLEILEGVRYEVKRVVPEIEVENIVMNATHTHTAPVVRFGLYPIPEVGVTQIEDYHSFFAKQTAQAVKEAWENRKPGSVTWGLGFAKIGHNRRATYSDNSAQMYGQTNVPEFRSIEGSEDQNVQTLFFWNQEGNLIAVAINVACPSQVVEHRTAINADYWHPLRQKLRKRFNSQLSVLGWIGASGDQSPHLMYGKAADERMRKLRGIDRLDEISRRILSAVEDTYEVVQTERQNYVPIIHRIEEVTLPMRIVTNSEYESSKKEILKIETQLKEDPKAIEQLFRRLNSFEGDVIKRYEQQRNNLPIYKTQIHVVKIGDIVICTNPFELFTDYGIAMQARSKALQTFVIQLSGPGTYLPTEKAIKGGHYSAVIQSTLVGPEGGQLLVDETIRLIDELF
jgi:hypothetical protein